MLDELKSLLLEMQMHKKRMRDRAYLAHNKTVYAAATGGSEALTKHIATLETLINKYEDK